MKPARAALMGGMGYPVTETPWGMPSLKSRLEAIGVQVLLVSWDARQDVHNFLHDFTGVRIMAGDSLGAGSAGQYPGDLAVKTDYSAGFQPSEYDERTRKDPSNGQYFQDISPKIVRAHCIFDPWWIDTGGLGYARWREQSPTKLLTTEHRGAHPDDWGYSQDLVYAEIQGLIA